MLKSYLFFCITKKIYFQGFVVLTKDGSYWIHSIEFQHLKKRWNYQNVALVISKVNEKNLRICFRILLRTELGTFLLILITHNSNFDISTSTLVWGSIKTMPFNIFNFSQIKIKLICKLTKKIEIILISISTIHLRTDSGSRQNERDP